MATVTASAQAPNEKSVQVSIQERKNVYKQSLKHFNDMRIAAYALDIIRGILIEFGKLFSNEIQSIELGAFISTTIALMIVLAVLLFIRSCKDYSRENECTLSVNCYLFANFLMLVATMSYFTGDNLTDLYDTDTDINDAENFRIASQILLITGIAGFRLLPQFKENMYKCLEEDDENALDDSIKENDKKEDKESIKETNVVQAYFNKNVALLPEIDAWYMAFINIFSTCSGTVTGAMWTAYGLAIIGTGAFLIAEISGDIQSLMKCNKAIIIIFGVIMFVATGLFLVSDNEMLLDCTIKCDKVRCYLKIILRIVCTTVSAIPIIFLIAYPVIIKKVIRKREEFKKKRNAVTAAPNS